MVYRTVFDVADAEFQGWGFIKIGLMIGAADVAHYYFRRVFPKGPPDKPKLMRFPYFGIGSMAILMVVSSWSIYKDQSSAIASKEFASVVEGVVTNFQPMLPGKGTRERFCVSTTCFQYTDNEITGRFNHTAANGGPIRDGLPVRVTYVGSSILKLEVGQ